MLKINFDPFPVLETERLIMRKPVATDIDEVFVHRSNPEHMKYIMHRFATERKQVEEMIDRIHNLIAKNEGINWAITQKGDDKILGMVGYVCFYNDHYRAEIGYTLHPPYQGKGIVHEAVSAAIQYGFDTLGLHSIEGIVNVVNEPSKKVLERLGFSKDAFFRDYICQNGKFIDANVYSLVKEN